MTGSTARLSFGVPIFNGANYVEGTLDSLLSQSTRAVILVSDNASTDNTVDLVRAAIRDHPQIALEVQEENRGAAWNFDRVFGMAATDYFGWVAHDDPRSPEFAAVVTRALASSDFIGVVTDTQVISPDGDALEVMIAPDELEDHEAATRLRAALHSAPEITVFGAYRREVLAATDRIAYYTGSDRVLAGQLALAGRIRVVHEAHQYLREHPGRSVRANRAKTQARFSHAREEWWSPSRGASITFPNWLRLRKLLAMTFHPQLRLMDRPKVFVTVCGFVFGHPRGPGPKLLLFDLAVAANRIAQHVRRLGTSKSSRGVTP